MNAARLSNTRVEHNKPKLDSLECNDMACKKMVLLDMKERFTIINLRANRLQMDIMIPRSNKYYPKKSFREQTLIQNTRSNYDQPSNSKS